MAALDAAVRVRALLSDLPELNPPPAAVAAAADSSAAPQEASAAAAVPAAVGAVARGAGAGAGAGAAVADTGASGKDSAVVSDSDSHGVDWQAWRDEDVLRFVRACRQDEDKAAAAIRQCVEWRRRYNICGLLAAPFPDFQHFRTVTPHAYHGEDRTGRPVYIERTGAVDMRQALLVYDSDILVARHVWQMELMSSRMREASIRHGRLIEQAMYVLDLKGFSLRPDSLGLAIFKLCSQFDQEFYPERLYKAVFVNASLFFRGVWKLVAPWLHPDTRKKFVILGSNFKEQLLEDVAPDQLPVEYGGTCTCGRSSEEGQATAESCVTPPCSLSTAEILALVGVEEETLAAGAVVERSVDMAAGTTAFWSWSVVAKDLLFGLRFVPAADTDGAGAAQVVVPIGDKLSGHSATYHADMNGKLEFTFSNAHSRRTSKVLRARIVPSVSHHEAATRELRLFSAPSTK